MQSLRRGTLYVVLAATVGAAWACSSDSSTPTPASSGSASGSSGSATSGSAGSGSASSGSGSGSATSGSAGSGSASGSSGSATSGSSGAGDDGGGMAGDDGGGLEAATTVPETGASTEGGGGGVEAGAPEGGAMGDGGGATFTAVYAIIQTSCLPCHAAGTGVTGGMLNMSTQLMAYTNLVGKPAAGSACTATGGQRVVPGMAMTSLLVKKLSATPGCGMRMPRGGTPLPAADIALIRSWINAGALNN